MEPVMNATKEQPCKKTNVDLKTQIAKIAFSALRHVTPSELNV